MTQYVKLFESWLNEATTELTPEDITKLLNQMVAIIKKTAMDSVKLETEFAERLNNAENDNEKTRIRAEKNAKSELIEMQIFKFLSSKGKVSEMLFEKILSWSKSIKQLFFKSEMANTINDFKKMGIDVSRWKEMYNPSEINNEIILLNQAFERETGIKPPVVAA